MVIVIKKEMSDSEIAAAKKPILEKSKQAVLIDFYGSLKGVFGDGNKYQLIIRNEWQ